MLERILDSITARLTARAPNTHQLAKSAAYIFRHTRLKKITLTIIANIAIRFE